MARTTAEKRRENSPPAKGGSSPAKGGATPQRSTPIKGRKSKNAIRQKKAKDPGWYLCGKLHQGCIMSIQITNSTFRTDAFFQPLIEKIASDDEDEINQIGLLGAYGMRISLENASALTNGSNGYQRRAFVCVLDEDEANAETMLAKLQVIKRFLEQPENNRYDTRVFIEQPGWDLTPPEPAPLSKLDHVFQYREIVRIIGSLFDNVDATWAVNNQESADCFFTAGYIPFDAVADLGFPVQDVIPNGQAGVVN